MEQAYRITVPLFEQDIEPPTGTGRFRQNADNDGQRIDIFSNQ
jgi:hypothetical protein